MASMELFRGDGRNTWQLRITDHRGFRRQVSMYTDKRGTALSISQKIELLIDYRTRCERPSPDLLQWLAVCRKEIQEKLVDWEIVDGRAVQGGRPLCNLPRPVPLPPDWKDPPPALVDLWEEALEGEEVSDEYSRQSAQRVRTLLSLEVADVSPLRAPADVTAESILVRLRELRRIGPAPKPGKTRKPLSPQTCNFYLEKAQQFFAWMVSKGFMLANPAAELEPYPREVVAQNKKRDRRALTREEQVLLITGTPALKDRWNMTGTERSLIYRTALRTGLRAESIQLLKVASFNFFTKVVTILATDNKASREEKLPIADELAPLLRAHFAGKHPQVPAFTPLCVDSYCKMLQEDLADLGIVYRDHLGKYADFHALRHTYGTELARVVMPAVHKQLMCHAEIETTMKFYTHIDDQDKAAGVAKLPALPEAPAPVDGQQAAG